MSRNANPKRHGTSRYVGYRLCGQFDGPTVERLLARAKADGVIIEYDTSRRYDGLWFTGAPGKAIRTLRKAIQAASAVPTTHEWFTK